jgi:hypothetical protein
MFAVDSSLAIVVRVASSYNVILFEFADGRNQLVMRTRSWIDMKTNSSLVCAYANFISRSP